MDKSVCQMQNRKVKRARTALRGVLLQHALRSVSCQSSAGKMKPFISGS